MTELALNNLTSLLDYSNELLI